VLGAYDTRCAISNLPVPELLQAAHIIPDRDERGRPEVPNGLCLSTLHHTAYDRNLLGIDPTSRKEESGGVTAPWLPCRAARPTQPGGNSSLPASAGDVSPISTHRSGWHPSRSRDRTSLLPC